MMRHKRGGTLTKLVAFRMSETTLSRLDELVAAEVKDGDPKLWHPKANRTRVLRGLIDAKFDAVQKAKITAEATPAKKPAAKKKAVKK